MHSDAPEVDERPTGHVLQLTSPTRAFEYVPPTHFSQVVDHSHECFPLSHTEQLDAPVGE